ncbi:MAG: hypothetical protein RL325_445 [Planctomycetota bacterium]|jgi:hypothetical protein
MAAKSGGGIGKLALLPIALLSALLFLQALGMLPPQVTNEVTRWASMLGFGYAAVVFAGAGAAAWCGLCAAMAVALNPLYPLPLGEFLHAAKILGGAIAAAAVVRSW